MSRLHWHKRVVLFAFSMAILTSRPLLADVQFNRDVRPILAAKCFECHGPDESSREADLRLDLNDVQLGPLREDNPVVLAGDVEASTLWQRVNSNDADESMPPSDSHIEPLTPVEKKILKAWIAEGAEYQTFWSFVAPMPQSLPEVRDSDWCQNHIDSFVLQHLEQNEMQPSQPADRRTLIRRLTLDLTGLPPTLDEIAHFLRDDSEQAYEHLVDRLIASPRYGEHMARYWLDVVRFADTNGIHHDHYREMTPYRDWVIRAYNASLPFDQFVVDQIAGDLYDSPSTDQLIASGFNRLHLVIDKGTAIPEESFARNVIDRVTAVGTAFMGLTVGCAVCHDHKYDPLTQRDFYQLYAFFNNIDAGPETPGQGLHAPFLRLPSNEQQKALDKIESKLTDTTQRIQRVKQRLEQVEDRRARSGDAAADAGCDDALSDAEAIREQLKELEASKKQLDQEKKNLEAVIPVSLIMKERKELRPTYILTRGAYDQPGEPVDRNTPSFLPPLRSAGETPSRMDLARWLVDGRHPLTARVFVNRIWQQFFGVGLVRTSEDFGTQGEWPSHPELLDDLANQFTASGWDVKRLVRSIVTSQTYRQDSRASRTDYELDPQNRSLARGSRFRLDAEVIRDQIMAVTGQLSRVMYGRSVKPPQPPGLWKTVSMVSSSTYSFEADGGENIHRRSIYSFWKRALPPPQMTIFDAPTRESCTARRERTNTPLQALVLMNEEQYFLAARHYAGELLAHDTLTDEERLKLAFESISSHQPNVEELAAMLSSLQGLRQIYESDPDSAEQILRLKETGRGSANDPVEIAAYTMLVNSLFSLDITKTRQ